ncbi:MAG: hypothetical protein AB7T27_08070 [Kiritimatiellia bacterium]
MKTGLRIIIGGLLLAMPMMNAQARGKEEPEREFVPLVRIRLLNPDRIGDEKTSVPGFARQVFKFMGNQAAWHVTPATNRMGWVSFCFTRPWDMSGLKADSVLTFAMEPADMDDRIGIVMADSKGNVSGVRPMSECRGSVLNNRGVYRVPVSGDSLNWTAINEVRLVVLHVFDERVTIGLQNLSIEPREWGRP